MILFLSLILNVASADLSEFLLNEFGGKCRSKNESSYKDELDEVTKNINNINTELQKLEEECRALVGQYDPQAIKAIYNKNLENEVAELEARVARDTAVAAAAAASTSTTEQSAADTNRRLLELKRLELEYQFASSNNSTAARAFQQLQTVSQQLTSAMSDPRCSDNERNLAAAQSALTSASSIFLSLPVTSAISQGFEIIKNLTAAMDKMRDAQNFRGVTDALFLQQASCTIEYFNHKYCRSHKNKSIAPSTAVDEGDICSNCTEEAKADLRRLRAMDQLSRSVKDIIDEATSFHRKHQSFMGTSHLSGNLNQRKQEVVAYLKANGFAADEDLASFFAIHSDVGLNFTDIPDNEKRAALRDYSLALNTTINSEAASVHNGARKVLNKYGLGEGKNAFLFIVTRGDPEQFAVLSQKLEAWQNEYVAKNGKISPVIASDAYSLVEFLQRVMPNSQNNINTEIDALIVKPSNQNAIRQYFQANMLNVLFSQDQDLAAQNATNRGLTPEEFRRISVKFDNFRDFVADITKEFSASLPANDEVTLFSYSDNYSKNAVNIDDMTYDTERIFSNSFVDYYGNVLDESYRLKQAAQYQAVNNPDVPIFQIFRALNDQTSNVKADAITLGHMEQFWQNFVSSGFNSFKSQFEALADKLSSYNEDVKQQICFNLNGFDERKDIPKKLYKACSEVALQFNGRDLTFADYVKKSSSERACVFSDYYDSFKPVK